MKQFLNIGLGGTFDRLHEGHKLFLDVAAHYGESVHIGLISEQYLKKNPKILQNIIQDYSTRLSVIKEYLTMRKCIISFSKIENRGMDRELALNANLNALIVSQETLDGAISINQLRRKAEKDQCTIILIPYVKRSDGKLLSSTQLRREETLIKAK